MAQLVYKSACNAIEKYFGHKKKYFHVLASARKLQSGQLVLNFLVNLLPRSIRICHNYGFVEQVSLRNLHNGAHFMWSSIIFFFKIHRK